MQYFTIAIAVVTLIGVGFFLFNKKPWEEMSPKERTFIITVIIIGGILLSIGAVAFFFIK